MSFASPADALARCDARTLGQLVTDDDTEQSPGELYTDPNLQTVLDDAAADIVSVAARAGRYTLANLQTIAASPTPEIRSSLIKLNVVLAVAALMERRMFAQEDIERAVPKWKWAQEQMALLNQGERIFDLAPNVAAANMSLQRIGAGTNLLGDMVEIYGINTAEIGWRR